ISHPSLTAQYIAYGALKDCSTDIDNMVKTYKSRRDLITSKLDSIENVGYVNPNGAFYAFIDLSKVSERFKYKDSFSIEFCN
ncbi:aminotransferase class I/II-fold pyridoxal phosphate-dependent enzyme, partial [Clostridioides difficile]|uniref:aminotransferase class I/II-fold pyridoxal phosphate-dependent enzyme n=1 Tax=Clostridioides difficile TaxID=1496 RepID=UPI001CA53A0D